MEVVNLHRWLAVSTGSRQVAAGRSQTPAPKNRMQVHSDEHTAAYSVPTIHCQSKWVGLSDSIGYGSYRRAAGGCGAYGSSVGQ